MFKRGEGRAAGDDRHPVFNLQSSNLVFDME